MRYWAMTFALHKTRVERVVHQLDVNGSGETFTAIRRRGIEISGTMRSWLHWLGHTGIGLSGAFIVATTVGELAAAGH